MLVQCLGRENPLEKGTATHSSILAWRIPWTEEPGGLQSWTRLKQLSNAACMQSPSNLNRSAYPQQQTCCHGGGRCIQRSESSCCLGKKIISLLRQLEACCPMAPKWCHEQRWWWPLGWSVRSDEERHADFSGHLLYISNHPFLLGLPLTCHLPTHPSSPPPCSPSPSQDLGQAYHLLPEGQARRIHIPTLKVLTESVLKSACG